MQLTNAKTSTKPHFSILDIGNGDMKFKSNFHKETLIFPSVISNVPVNSDIKKSSGDLLDNLVVMHNDEMYFVGNSVFRNTKINLTDTTEDKFLSEITSIMVSTALGLLARQPYQNTKAIIAVPLAKLSETEIIKAHYQGKEFKCAISETHDFRDTPTRIVKIDDVEIMGQPFGTYFYLLLNEDGTVKEDADVDGVAIFDIGAKTNDGIIIDDFEELSGYRIQNKFGMYKAYSDIRLDLMKEFKMDLPEYIIPNIVRKRRVKDVDITQTINKHFFNLALSIAQDINSQWQDAYMIRKYVFTGGGVNLLKPYLQKFFPNAIFLEDCRTANADGFEKYARMIWS
jgi:hypothetical protein